jgi:hypothetical protein
MLPFTAYFGANHSTFSDRQLRLLAPLLDAAVAVDDELENAVSTCFLEHLHQIRCYRVLARHLSAPARRRSRA